MVTEAGAEFAGRRVAVVGLGRSNAAVVRFLLRGGATVEAYERQTASAVQIPELQACAVRACGPDYLESLARRLDGLAAIFVTPGMRKDEPPLGAAAQAGVPLWTEAAYVLEVARVPVLGITGSAGKTTTTTLVGDVVRRFRPGSLVGGNIGLPLIDRLSGLAPGAWLVLELSSFQLELCRTDPAVAAVLNVRPNHLDVHGSMDAYVQAKRRIYRFQRPGDFAVFGRDDPGSAALEAEAPAGRLGFSAAGPVDAGAGVISGAVTWAPPAPGPATDRPAPWPWPATVVPAGFIAVPGRHNVENVAAASAVCLAAGIPPDLVAASVAAFRGVEHRQEWVRLWRGTRWINDSIATTPDRCAAALETFAGQRLVLLAGGYDKRLPFGELGLRIAASCSTVILFGATAGALQEAVEAGASRAGCRPRIARVPDLDRAVEEAAAAASPGDVVLLSPACASFDQFRDFEQRGRRFRELVLALPE